MNMIGERKREKAEDSIKHLLYLFLLFLEFASVYNAKIDFKFCFSSWFPARTSNLLTIVTQKEIKHNVIFMNIMLKKETANRQNVDGLKECFFERMFLFKYKLTLNSEQLKNVLKN